MEEDLKMACDTLRNGGVILYPTDTIWGIGCDATNEEAVKRVYAIKQRIDSKSMLVLLNATTTLPYYVDEVPDLAFDLIEMSNKPLTIIYSGAKNVAPNLLADDGSLGIRITSEQFTSELIRRFRKPIVSTSANISGQPSPGNFAEVSPEIIQAVDYVVTYRQDDRSKANASGIIKLGKGGLIKVIRE